MTAYSGALQQLSYHGCVPSIAPARYYRLRVIYLQLSLISRLRATHKALNLLLAVNTCNRYILHSGASLQIGYAI